MSSSEEDRVVEPSKSLNRKIKNDSPIDSDDVDMEGMVKDLFEDRKNSNKLCDILRYLQVNKIYFFK